MAESTAATEIKELAKVPERIRNICTSAHIHHGKCIDGKSRLILANGEIKTAEQIYQLAEQKGQKFEEKEEHTIYDVSKANKEEYDIIKIVTNNGRQNTILVQKNTFKDLAFVEVENISEGYEETVYDFTVPENHTFVAEGIVMHNTALTDNLLAASGHISSKAAGDLEAGMAMPSATNV